MSSRSNDIVTSIELRRTLGDNEVELRCILGINNDSQRTLSFPISLVSEKRFTDAQEAATQIIEELRESSMTDDDELALWLAKHFFTSSIRQPYYLNLVARLLDTIVDVVDDGIPRTYRWEAIRV